MRRGRSWNNCTSANWLKRASLLELIILTLPWTYDTTSFIASVAPWAAAGVPGSGSVGAVREAAGADRFARCRISRTPACLPVIWLSGNGPLASCLVGQTEEAPLRRFFNPGAPDPSDAGPPSVAADFALFFAGIAMKNLAWQLRRTSATTQGALSLVLVLQRAERNTSRCKMFVYIYAYICICVYIYIYIYIYTYDRPGQPQIYKTTHAIAHHLLLDAGVCSNEVLRFESWRGSTIWLRHQLRLMLALAHWQSKHPEIRQASGNASGSKASIRTPNIIYIYIYIYICIYIYIYMYIYIYIYILKSA